MQAKDAKEATEYFRRSLSIAEELAVAEPKNADHQRDITAAKQSLAQARPRSP
jgi:hypothetical protein